VSKEPSAEFIQEKILANFQAEAKKFYNNLEDEYLEDLRAKMLSGTIEVDEDTIKEVALEQASKYDEYIKKDKKLETFVKKYVNDTFDLVCDSLSEGLIEQEEAEVAFTTLKYILTAGKICVDEKSQLKSKKLNKK
jgi:hypothetical protein